MNHTLNLNVATAVTATSCFAMSRYSIYHLCRTIPNTRSRVIGIIYMIAAQCLLGSSLLARMDAKSVSDYFGKFAFFSLASAALISIPTTIAFTGLFYSKTIAITSVALLYTLAAVYVITIQ